MALRIRPNPCRLATAAPLTARANRSNRSCGPHSWSSTIDGTTSPSDAAASWTPPRNERTLNDATRTRTLPLLEHRAERVDHRRRALLLQVVEGPERRPLDLHELAQVDRRRDHDHVRRRRVDHVLELVQLTVRVPRRREHRPDVVLLVDLLHGADGELARVDDLRRAVLARRDDAGPVVHPAVRERGAVLD